jgi:hypothetical protein
MRVLNDQTPREGMLGYDSRMADTYDPPRIEQRTDIGSALIGGPTIGSGVQNSAAFRPL